MSTRSQIKIVDNSGSELWFYRHSDGYPGGNLPVLREFVGMIKEGLIRNNVEQSAGWLIIAGAKEYAYNLLPDTPANKELDWGARMEKANKIPIKKIAPIKGLMGWKVGAYEPCPCKELRGDVEWLYEVNVETKEIKISTVGSDNKLTKTVVDRPDLSPEEIEKLF